MPFLGGIVRRPAITRHDHHVTTTACLTCVHCTYDTMSLVELCRRRSDFYRRYIGNDCDTTRAQETNRLSPCGRTLATNNNRSSTTPTVTEMRRATTRHNISKPHINVHVLYNPLTIS